MSAELFCPDYYENDDDNWPNSRVTVNDRWEEDWNGDDDYEEEERCRGGYRNSECGMETICDRADECSKCGAYQYYP